MSPQCKKLEALIQAVQQDRELPGVVALLREICTGAAKAAPVDDLIGLAMYVLEMGKKAGRDQASSN